MTTIAFLDDLQAAARDAESAEATFRREMAARLAVFEQERAFAFRRINLMKAIAEAVVAADDEEAAVAHALAALRTRLGWSSDSDVRAAVVARFAPVAQAVATSITPSEEAQDTDVRAALMQFESWYAQVHGTPFWVLFEHYMPETPLVDF